MKSLILLPLIRAINYPSSLRNQIKEKHNELRNLLVDGKVANLPQAEKSSMIQLYYCGDLERDAQLYSQKCDVNADPTTKDGQNHNVHSDPATSDLSTIVLTQIQEWWDENIDYTYKEYQTGDPASMFSQMASEYVVKVGCATITTCTGSDFPGATKYFTICRYGPSGNEVGRKPYTQAKTMTIESKSQDYTDTERDLILNKHNSYRQKLSNGDYSPQLPKPVNNSVPEIFYCRIFESEAKEIADKCEFDPVNGRQGTSYAKTSSSAWLQSAPDLSIIVGQQIDSWWSEKEFYTYGNYDPNSPAKNFQKMAWDNLVKVGCFTTDKCSGGDFPVGEKTFFTVCRYWDVENGPGFGESLGKLPNVNERLWPTIENLNTLEPTAESTTPEPTAEQTTVSTVGKTTYHTYKHVTKSETISCKHLSKYIKYLFLTKRLLKNLFRV